MEKNLRASCLTVRYASIYNELTWFFGAFAGGCCWMTAVLCARAFIHGEASLGSIAGWFVAGCVIAFLVRYFRSESTEWASYYRVRLHDICPPQVNFGFVFAVTELVWLANCPDDSFKFAVVTVTLFFICHVMTIRTLKKVN